MLKERDAIVQDSNPPPPRRTHAHTRTHTASLPTESLPNAVPIMDESNYLNVYKGPNSVQKYFDPDSGPPLALVEIPECLNPYRGDGVRIYAKMMTMHPANNVKSMPGKTPPGRLASLRAWTRPDF